MSNASPRCEIACEQQATETRLVRKGRDFFQRRGEILSGRRQESHLPSLDFSLLRQRLDRASEIRSDDSNPLSPVTGRAEDTENDEQ